MDRKDPESVSMIDSGQFQDAMRAFGLTPPETIQRGQLHRFPGVGKSNGNQAGWCVLFENGLGGCFGDWSSGLSEIWQAKREQSLTDSDRSDFQRRVAEATKAREKIERDSQQAEAARKAKEIWNLSGTAQETHPYLELKGIRGHGTRIYEESLVVPLYDSETMCSLQFIQPDGAKRFLSGGRTQGCYFLVGSLRDPEKLCVAEGFATGATIHQATGYPVAVAFNAGNLKAVAQAMRERFPDLALVICADDDAETEGNPGLTKATEAARAVGGRLAIPDFQGDCPHGATDFNDLAAVLGLEAVANGVENAKFPNKEGVEIYEVGGEPPKNWPELVPLDAPNLPRLEPAHLPEWAGAYAQALAENTETPIELTAGLILATCATAMARRLRVRVKPDYFEPCNIWVVVVLPSGNRKSAVQAASIEPLVAWEYDESKRVEQEIKRITSERKTIETRIKELRAKAAKVETSMFKELEKEIADQEINILDIPVLPRLWTSDATPEGLGNLLAEHKDCIGWLSSEGGIFDLLEGRYSNGISNLDLVLKAHSGDSERVDRTGRPPVFLKNPRLSIGLSPQPDVLRGLAAKPGFRGRGLLGRFLYFIPPSPLGYRPLKSNPVPHGVRETYATGIRAILDWEPAINEQGDENPHVLHFGEEAFAVWLTFARSIEERMRPGGELEHFTDWAGKAPGAVARLAGILHGIKHAHGRPWEVAITLETAKQALGIMETIIPHTLAAFDMMGTDPTLSAARQIWEWVKRNRLSRFTVREGFNALRCTFPRVQRFRDALEVLEERGYVEVMEEKPNRPGRPPSPTVYVRPEIVKSWQKN